ncbi:MAG: response regulator [Desulfobacteraceae bacterium]|nr:MAG: response regulator [Desulfobacteraceae bacterium]
MKNAKSVLVIDDEPIVCERLQPVLEKEGFLVEAFTQSDAAVARLQEKPFHVVVTDMRMKGPSGMDILRFIKDTSPGTQVIVITGYATMETNREAEVIGAFEFIAKPFHMKDLSSLVKRAARKARI